MATSNFDTVRIEERRALLRRNASDLVLAGFFPHGRVILRNARIDRAVDAYFLLNDVYKRLRIHSGHFTENAKIAALQALAIAELQPLYPVYPEKCKTIYEYQCNEIFALDCASSLMGKKIDSASPDRYLRILDIIRDSTAFTLHEYIADLNQKLERPLSSYRLKIDERDFLSINSLISIFELLP